MTEEAPILIRIFKDESELEVWKQKRRRPLLSFQDLSDLQLFGRARAEDQARRQAGAGRLLSRLARADEPGSKYHLSFESRLPQRLRPRAWPHRRDIMVHGDCTSAGCYAMTDALIEEIFMPRARGAARRPGAVPGPCLPVPHDGGQHGAHKDEQVVRFLEEPERRLRLLRDQPSAAEVAVCEKRYRDQRRLRAATPRAQSDRRLPAFQRSCRFTRAPGMQEASTKPAPRRSSRAGEAARQRARAELRADRSPPTAPSRSAPRRPAAG